MAGSNGRYLPFGGWRTEPTADLTDMGFTSHKANNTGSGDIGLIYMNARYYLPGVGRFLSADTIVPDPASPQSYNRYSYVFNNPMAYTDPSGHCPWCVSAATGAAADIVGQMLMTYFFDPNAGSFEDLWNSINWAQVVWSGIEGAVIPGGPLGSAILGAAGEVAVNGVTAWWNGEAYTAQDALGDFAFGFVANLAGDMLGGLVQKYGGEAVQAGLRKLDDLTGANVSSLLPCHSFSADTLVTTEDGLIPISELSNGEYVLAYDETTGETGYYPIEATWLHLDPVIVYLTIDGETIEATPTHPFYTDMGWVEAGDLQPGTAIRTAFGGYGMVENIQVVLHPQPMYDLTVATVHTFFVGYEQWLVHNCGDAYDIARQARDAHLGTYTSGTQAANDAMVVGAYHPQTGVSTVGVSCHGVCAEQNAAAALNVNPSEIIFSEPIRPRYWYGGKIPLRSIYVRFV